MLHSLLTNHARHFGRWVPAEWHAQYNKHARVLVPRESMAYFDLLGSMSLEFDGSDVTTCAVLPF